MKLEAGLALPGLDGVLRGLSGLAGLVDQSKLVKFFHSTSHPKFGGIGRNQQKLDGLGRDLSDLVGKS